MRHGPTAFQQSQTSNGASRRHRATLLSAAALFVLTLSAPASAQQAYFRGEAEPDGSVTVNLSAIDKLRGGGSPAPLSPLPAPSVQTPTAQVPSVQPPGAPTSGLSAATAAATRSGSGTLAAPPSTMPQSGLVAPSGGQASGSIAAAPATPPSSSLEAAAPPPPPNLDATPVPTPVPVPTPTPVPVPAPAPSVETPSPAPEQVEDAPEVAAAPPPPAPPEPAPPPPPTPEPIAAPPVEAAPTEDSVAEEDKVASVNLTELDSSGILRRDDGLSVLFIRDSQDLPASAEPALGELAERMTANEDLTLTLHGYSEAIGDSGSKPRRLSLFRALAVRTFLLKEGIDSRRMNVQALGTKDDNADRPPNRVDLTVNGG